MTSRMRSRFRQTFIKQKLYFKKEIMLASLSSFLPSSNLTPSKSAIVPSALAASTDDEDDGEDDLNTARVMEGAKKKDKGGKHPNEVFDYSSL
jgi:hypothetical protein